MDEGSVVGTDNGPNTVPGIPSSHVTTIGRGANANARVMVVETVGMIRMDRLILPGTDKFRRGQARSAGGRFFGAVFSSTVCRETFHRRSAHARVSWQGLPFPRASPVVACEQAPSSPAAAPGPGEYGGVSPCSVEMRDARC